jgi:mRNA interferase RelE/StbE
MSWNVIVSEPAADHIRSINDKRIQKLLVEKIKNLAVSPEKQGKSLAGDLAEYRSVRAVGQRYRIIFQVHNETVCVLVVAIGLRKDGAKKDIYKLAQKLVRLGLAE